MLCSWPHRFHRALQSVRTVSSYRASMLELMAPRLTLHFISAR